MVLVDVGYCSILCMQNVYLLYVSMLVLVRMSSVLYVSVLYTGFYQSLSRSPFDSYLQAAY